MKETILVAADPFAVGLKKAIVAHLEKRGFAVKDMGAAVVDGIKDAVKGDDPDIEVVIEDEAPAEEPEVINIPVEDPTEE